MSNVTDRSVERQVQQRVLDQLRQRRVWRTRRAIDTIRGGRTLIVVAHRLPTIMTADQIIMLDGDGGIRETGTHTELLAADGAYGPLLARTRQRRRLATHLFPLTV